MSVTIYWDNLRSLNQKVTLAFWVLVTKTTFISNWPGPFSGLLINVVSNDLTSKKCGFKFSIALEDWRKFLPFYHSPESCCMIILILSYISFQRSESGDTRIIKNMSASWLKSRLQANFCVAFNLLYPLWKYLLSGPKKCNFKLSELLRNANILNRVLHTVL